MNTTDNLELNLTGDTNMGNLYRLMSIHSDMTVYEQALYLAVGRYSLGYCRPSTNVPSEHGTNRNSKAWADSLGMSKSAFLKAKKSLEARKLIKVHTGSLFRQDGGSYPDYYSIVFQPELQKKHHIYFNTSGIKPKEAPKQEANIEDYFVFHDVINLIRDSKGTSTKEFQQAIDDGMRYNTLADTYPTEEQLQDYLITKGLN